MDINHEFINNLYRFAKKVITFKDIPVGYIGNYTISFNSQQKDIQIKGICLDKYITNQEYLILLSGFTFGREYLAWLPIDILHITTVKFRNTEIRTMFRNQLELYRNNKLSDEVCLNMNNEIIHKCGYLTSNEFAKLLKEETIKKLGKNISLQIGYKDITITQEIPLYTKDKEYLIDKILNLNGYKEQFINKEKGEVYITNEKNKVTAILDISYICMMGCSSLHDRGVNQLYENYGDKEIIFSMNKEIKYNRKIRYDTDFYYSFSVIIPINSLYYDWFYKKDNVKEILNQVSVKE